MESFGSGGVFEKCSQFIAPLYLYRGGALACTPLMGGLRSYAAGDELVGFVKECLVVDEDLYVDPEATDDVEDANHFAQKLQALYEDVLANVTECLMYVHIYMYIHLYIYKDRI